MFLKNFQKLKIYIIPIILVSIFTVLNFSITYAYEPGTTINFKIFHDYKTHQDVEEHTMIPQTVIDLKRYVKEKDGYKAVYYSIDSPVSLENYGDDVATIRYEKIEIHPPTPITPPAPEPTPIMPPTTPSNPPVSNEEEAYIYVYHESTAGHNILATETIKGKAGETLDLRNYIRDIATFKHNGFNPSSGIVTFDAKRRQKTAVIYEKDFKPSKDSQVYPKPSTPTTPSNPPGSNEEEAYIYVYHESTAGHNILASETVKGKAGETLDLRNYIRDVATYKHHGFNPSSGIVTFDSKRRQKTAVIYEKNFKPSKDSQVYPKPNQNNNQTKQNENPKTINNNSMNNLNNQNNINNQNYINPEENINNINNPNEAVKYMKLSKNRNIKLINGYPDNSMKPNKPVSREEVAYSLYRLLDENYKTKSNGVTPDIKDVDSDRWSYIAISKLLSEDIMQNMAAGVFRPKESATRAQVAMAIAGIIYEGGTMPMNAEFSDTTDNIAESAIALVTSKGIMNGYPDGTFKPEKSITRVEFIVVLNRLMGKNESDIINNIDFYDVKPSSWYYNEVQMAVQGE